ncbi:hypothetical protein GCM10027347_56410 [Larkinella harenae]
MKKQLLSKIALVEKNRYLATIVHTFLSPYSEVILFSNGLELMEWLERGNQPDLIITELDLPNFSGAELITYIRKNLIYQHVPIIILSALLDSDSRISCFELGADSYLSKPFNPLELVAKVRAILRLQESISSQETPSASINTSPTFLLKNGSNHLNGFL